MQFSSAPGSDSWRLSVLLSRSCFLSGNRVVWFFLVFIGISILSPYSVRLFRTLLHGHLSSCSGSSFFSSLPAGTMEAVVVACASSSRATQGLARNCLGPVQRRGPAFPEMGLVAAVLFSTQGSSIIARDLAVNIRGMCV